MINIRPPQSATGVATSTYAYDHLGNRVKLVEGSVTTIFPSSLYNVVLGATASSTATTTKHIFANGLNVASIESGGASSGGVSTSTIALDATSTSITNGYAGGPVTKTWTHTVTGTNPVIILSASIWQDVAGTGSVTSASWNGGAFVKATSTRSGGMQSEVWYLIATTTGAKTMSVTVTGATDAIKLGAASFSGVSSFSPLNLSNASSGVSGSPALSLTSLANGEAAIATLSRFSTTDATTSKTSLYKDKTGSVLGAASYQVATTTGSYTDTYTGSANQDWSMSILSLRPATTSVAATGSTTVRYMFADHLGGTTVVTDQNAAIVESIDYTPFGATRLDMKVGAYTGERRKYAQTEFDSLSQLNYMMARYENSARGQFVSQDPVFLGTTQNLSEPQSLNAYSYANGNPLSNSDPNGNSSMSNFWAYNGSSQMAAAKAQAYRGMQIAVGLPLAIYGGAFAAAGAIEAAPFAGIALSSPYVQGGLTNVAVRGYLDYEDDQRINNPLWKYGASAVAGVLQASLVKEASVIAAAGFGAGVSAVESRLFDNQFSYRETIAAGLGAGAGRALSYALPATAALTPLQNKLAELSQTLTELSTALTTLYATKLSPAH